MVSPSVTYTIDDLHEDPLLDVFDRFPLFDLLAKVDQVCRRWNRLRGLALARRRSITVLVNDAELRLIKSSRNNVPFLDQVTLPREHHLRSPDIEFRYIHDSFIHLTELTQDRANLLVDFFPCVRTLRVVARGRSCKSQITYLLNKWRNTLVIFKLWIGQSESVRDEQVDLLRAINGLTRIKRLVVEMKYEMLASDKQYITQIVHNRFHPGERQPVQYPQVDLPVLARLSQFHLATWDHPSCLVDSLIRYATPDLLDIRLTMAELYVELPNFENVPLGTRANIHSISNLKATKPINVDREFELVCGQFRGLSTLSVQLKDTTSMAQLARKLEPLAHSLVYLKVRFVYSDRLVQPPLELADVQPLCPLVGVRILALNSQALMHRVNGQGRIAEIFPNLQVANVVDNFVHGVDCEVCESSAHLEQITKCIRLQLKPFEQCTSLKAIFCGEYPPKQFSRGELFGVHDQTDMSSNI